MHKYSKQFLHPFSKEREGWAEWGRKTERQRKKNREKKQAVDKRRERQTETKTDRQTDKKQWSNKSVSGKIIILFVFLPN